MLYLIKYIKKRGFEVYKKAVKICYRAICVFLSAVILLSVFGFIPSSNAATEYFYETNKKQTLAVLDCITVMYITKYPSFGLVYEYGSERDKAVLSELAKEITSGRKTDGEKALAISKWVTENTTYNANRYTVSYPIDVYYEKTAACYGYAQLISRLMRFCGIPAVVCTGVRADMQKTVTKQNLQNYVLSSGHAWTMAYYENKWHLYDPLFHTENVTDLNTIAKNYYCNIVEGVSPYYSGMDISTVNNGSGIFYIDGRLMQYYAGAEATRFNGLTQEINGINYIFITNLNRGDIIDGWEYVESPQKTATMRLAQAYYDGMIRYMNNSYKYAQPNGVISAGTTVKMNGALLTANTDGWLYTLSGIENRQFYFGRPVLISGETAKAGVTWNDSEFLRWSSNTPATASVDSNGNIKALSPGYAEIQATNGEFTSLNIDLPDTPEGTSLGNKTAKAGDLDADGSVTATDARIALRAAVGLDKLTGALEKAADMDSDNSVTAADARIILRIAVGLEKA